MRGEHWLEDWTVCASREISVLIVTDVASDLIIRLLYDRVVIHPPVTYLSVVVVSEVHRPSLALEWLDLVWLVLFCLACRRLM